jgi:type II secretory ATPase GspE/PulE/Tfp pilus assembly ATPase PilB-like protein
MLNSVLLAAVEPGGYLNGWKALPLLILLWIWARLLTWIDKDSEIAHLPRTAVNSGMLAGLALGTIFFFALPGFLLALSVFVAFFAIDMGVYLMLRHQRVGLGDLSEQLSEFFSGILKRGNKEAKAAAGDVQLVMKSGAPVGAPAADAPEALAYSLSQKVLADPLRKSAEMIDLVPGDGGYQARFAKDGVTYPATTLTREDGGTTIEYFKYLAGLNPTEKRKPQTGVFKTVLAGNKREMSLTTSGSSAGERAVMQVNLRQKHDITIDQLGFADDQLEQLVALVQDPGGIVILTTPPGQGLTTLFYAVLRKHDAFLEHIQTIEKEIMWDLEGVTQNALPSGATPADEAKQVEWTASQEPDVLGLAKIEDPSSARTAIKFATTGKRVYVAMRASSTFSALEQWRKLVGDDKVAMSQLRMIVNGRLLRRLCVACKVQYAADPERLRKLNMSQDRAASLFQARTQPLRDQKGNPIVCEFCQDLRYNGRIGAFEMFGVDDEVRNVVVNGGSQNQLKALFRKQRRRYLQERALAIVEAGETSVEEVLRVLKDPPSQGSSGSSSRK